MAEPTLFLAQTYNQVSALPEIGKVLPSGTTAGFAGDYGVRDQLTVENGAKSRAPLDPYFLDTGHAFGRPLIPKNLTKPSAPWVAAKEPVNTKNSWNTFMAAALKTQRALNPDYLIAPGVENHDGQNTEALESQVKATRAAWNGRPSTDPDWLARICVHADWVKVPKRRGALLNELSDLPDDVGVALHVRWRKKGAMFDQDSLEALREVVKSLVADDRKVVLLRAGLIGWLATAWGATAFTAGLPYSSWWDEGLTAGGSAKGAKKKDWFFEPSILLRVERPIHDQLAAQQGYKACTCAFCGQLPADWRSNSERHALWSLACLTAGTQAAQLPARVANVKAALDAAQKVWDAWAGQAIKPSQTTPKAKHLETWASVV